MNAVDAPPRHFLARAYAPLVQARTWKATLFLLINLALGVTWFTVMVTMLSLSAGLMVTLLGLPLLVATVAFGRWVASVERRRIRIIWGDQLEPFPRPELVSGSWWQRTRRALGDSGGWRGVAYGFISLPWGILTFTVTVVVWSVSLSMAAFPIAAAFIPDNANSGPYHLGTRYVLHGWGRVGFATGVCLLGLVLLVAAPRTIAAIARADRRIVRLLCSPSATWILNRRVEALTVSRDASVEGAAVELRRIERDLHDGAQQRLVAVAMDLGLARQRLAEGGDPERANELVARAHEESKLAISELRELVRGIHPAVLTDRGLDAALSALAARSPIPITVDVELERRPAPPVEAAAYFVVAESLANIAKHSRANRGSVTITGSSDSLRIEITDDGIGGAAEIPGGGLSGLHDRVTAMEGTLRISSPQGGPTMLAVELPCGS